MLLREAHNGKVRKDAKKQGEYVEKIYSLIQVKTRERMAEAKF